MKKILIFLTFFLFFATPILAEEKLKCSEEGGCIGEECENCVPPCCIVFPPPQEGCESPASWYEYRANKDECGSEKPELYIEKGECHWKCVKCKETEEGKKVCKCWIKVCIPIDPKIVAYCNFWQVPQRACEPVTAWGEKVYCGAAPECFLPIKVERFLDGRGEMPRERIYLPVKFQFQQFATPYQSGWGLSCGPNQIRVRISNKIVRILNIWEAFSITTNCGIDSDKKILEELWKAENSYPKLADFLIKFTGDRTLESFQGDSRINTNIISSIEKERKTELWSTTYTALTFHRDYEKLRRGKEFTEIKKQIEYFIHFTEDKEVERCYKEGDWVIEDYLHCGCFGGRCPERPSAKVLVSVTNFYSPSQDKKVGPCKIEEGKPHTIIIEFCINGKCGAREGPPLIPFTTVNAPEPIGVLAFKKDKIDLVLAYRPGIEKEERLFFSATATVWVDTDWNGDGWPEIPSEFGADFVDFWFCKQNIDLPKPDSPKPFHFEFRALYRDRKMIFDPAGCLTDPELAKLEETKPRECIKIDEECICDINPSFCDKYCGKKGWIENLDICHPFQHPESLRIEEKAILNNIQEFREKNKANEEPKDCPHSYPFATSFNIFLGRIETIKVDWPDNPYYGIEGLNIPYPKDLWKWDIYGLNQYFPASPMINVWQVKKAESKDWSQKWHFKLTAKVPLKEKKKTVEWTGLDLLTLYMYAVTANDEFLLKLISEIGNWKKRKVELVEMTEKDFKETIKFRPKYLPEEDEQERLVFNRLQLLEFKPVGRALSYSIEVYCEGKKLNFPVIFTHLRYRKVLGIRESQLKNFTFWEVWPCLKCEGEGDINKRRLNRLYQLKLQPCKDEWGEKSLPISTSLNIKSTGSPPKNLSPPLPNPALIPRYFRFDPAPGALSYVVEINGKKYFNVSHIESCEKECRDPVTGKVEECKKGYCPEKEYYFASLEENKEYVWKVKSCADSCSLVDKEEFLHCGEFSKEVEFFGCTLKTSLISPVGGETFLREENINLSWSKVDCQNATVYYQLKVSFSKTEKEEDEEMEKICKEKDGKLLIDKIQTENNFNLQLDPLCYGTYFWQARACLSENCEEEAGKWTPPSYFNISKTKAPREKGEFKGLGLCQKLVPECPPEGCGIKEIPKLIFNIVNCLLWTGIPVLIIIGIGFTGFTLIFFATSTHLLERVKQIWRGILVGSLIMLFAWTILNIIFKILGWRREIFGDWWTPF